MSACEPVKIRNRKICIGDLKHLIKIQIRVQRPGGITTMVDYEEEFEDVSTQYAAVDTNRGFKSFNNVGTNQAGVVQEFTHKFYIRYSQECLPTSENWIEFQCDRFKIIDVEIMDERNRFVSLKCVKKGTKNLEGNSA